MLCVCDFEYFIFIRFHSKYSTYFYNIYFETSCRNSFFNFYALIWLMPTWEPFGSIVNYTPPPKLQANLYPLTSQSTFFFAMANNECMSVPSPIASLRTQNSASTLIVCFWKDNENILQVRIKITKSLQSISQ